MASRLRSVFSKKSEDEISVGDLYCNTEIARHGLPHEPMCMTFDPLQSLLAIGTRHGAIRIFGRPGVDVLLRHDDDVAVVCLQFVVNQGQLISATSDDYIHLWELKDKQHHIIHSLKFQRDRITCLHMPFQCTWLYVGTDKGNLYLVNVDKFEMSGYTIMWNKTMDVLQKNHPGFVTQITENPVDSNRLLIGYETGMIVLWDSMRRVVEYHYKSSDVKYVSWHHEGKMFMSCHGDGSLSVWNIKSSQGPEKSWVPHSKENNGKSSPHEDHQPITKVEWKSTKSNDPVIIFTDGLPKDRDATPSLTVTHQGNDVVTFKLDYPIIDFNTICSTPFGNAVQDPTAVVVLMQKEFVVIDLLSNDLLPFEAAYPLDIHESRVTCCYYMSNCNPDIIPAIYSVGAKQKKRKFSDKEWPIKGGHWGSAMFSYSEVILTGHEDGSVKFWDATAVTLQALYKLRTAKLFEPASVASPSDEATPPHQQAPPTFHKNDANSHSYAVHHIAFCDQSRLLCVGGHCHMTLFNFTKNESSVDCPAIDIHLVFQNFDAQLLSSPDQPIGFEVPSIADAGEGQQELQRTVFIKPGSTKWLPGYKPKFCCCLVWHHGNLPSPITSLVLNSKFGLLAVGNDVGLAVVDILSETCIFAFPCPDLYGTSDPFSRHAPPPPTVSDQSEDKTQGTPVSSPSTSTENSNNLLPVGNGNNNNNSHSNKTKDISNTMTVIVSAHDLPQEGSVRPQSPKAPPRRKKQARETKKRESQKSDSEIATPSSSSGTPVMASSKGPPSVIRPVSLSPLASPVGVPLTSQSPLSTVSCDSWLIADIEDKRYKAIESVSDGEGHGQGQIEERSRQDQAELESCNECSSPQHSNAPNLNKVCCCCLKQYSNRLIIEEARLLTSNESVPTFSEGPHLASAEISPQTSLPQNIGGSEKVGNSEFFLPLSDPTVTKVPTFASDSDTIQVSTAKYLPSQRIVLPPPLTASNRNPSPSVEPATHSWRSKLNRVRQSFMSTVNTLIANQSESSRIKFKVIDLTNDVPAILKETSYSAYSKKCKALLLSEKGDILPDKDDTVNKELILQLVFIDSFPIKNEATSTPCLWVGTSLGSVLVLSIGNPTESESSNPDPIVVPTGTIFRLKGSIVDISFLESTGTNSIIQPSGVQWKDFGKKARTCFDKQEPLESPAEILQYVILTSDRQISVIALPSLSCLQKHKITDSNLILKAKAVFIKDTTCLLTYHTRGDIMIFELPSLKVLQDFAYTSPTHSRFLKTFNFSNFGHGAFMLSPTELQKFIISKGPSDIISDLYGDLYTTCQVPEPPKAGFFQSLFDNQTGLDREALFGESGSGKPSKTLTTYVSKMNKTQESAAAATSDISRAKQAALERGEKLSELEERTGMLRSNAEAYADLSSQLKNKFKEKKWFQF